MAYSTMKKVGMADLDTCLPPGIITTLGLGSCVGIALYDPITKIGGLAHVMLPDSTQIRNNDNKAKFADTGTIQLIEEMVKIGANKNRLVAKLAGGAQMFSFQQTSDLMRIGERNVIATKAILKEIGIPILAEDTGANYGRTIELHTKDGVLVVKSIGRGKKEL